MSMTKGRTVLGRGLASLIPRVISEPVQTSPAAHTGRQDTGEGTEIIVNIDLDRIQPNPYQPRADFDPVALDELKRSIIEKGVIQPITARRVDGGYQLVSGERRVRAAREAGLRQIPAYIIFVRADEEMLELALIENLQREHLNPIEVAISYKRLMDECRLTHEEVSQKIGKDRSTITNFLRLLRLPETIQTAVRRGIISSGHARALVAIENSVLQSDIFERVVEKDLSVRDVERLVRESGKKRRRPRTIAVPSAGNADLSYVEDRLRQFLGTKVQVKQLQDGKGEILIEYYSQDDLNRILDIFADLQHRS
jgi:ParB family chromosome partitioning protein